MTGVTVYVENHVAMAFDEGSAAWTFQLRLWGRCAQGSDERTALHDLQRSLGADDEITVAERVHGDEQAFARDRLLEYRSPAGDLLEELQTSADHVRRTVETMPADLTSEADAEVWTTVKVLRRLAWHERDELRVMRAMLGKARGR